MSTHGTVALAITSVAGKMGRAVLQELLGARPDGLRLAAALHRPSSTCIGLDAGHFVGLDKSGVVISSDWSADHVDVLIDFSLPEPSLQHLAACVEQSVPMVIGTTGFTTAQRAIITRASERIPIVLAPNMSVGVNVCFYLLDQITRVVGADADIEISETHHRHKIDAPSGTAIKMGEIIANARSQNLDDVAVYSRAGNLAPRQSEEIGISSLRAGDVVGDHSVLFALLGERIELTHKASSRQTFAIGALRAANWLAEQPAGCYDMQDVLGLRP